ncbi:hypothetical protein [Endozoicomonas arenosclerae]|uniref:hypothetical protein n=1 Tax=Endozoicomonas arenosclerae TaxID=1633495 RepID=UPI000A7CF748|nr:hypothetical protein [Endozoicomonas arenosclerae]
MQSVNQNPISLIRRRSTFLLAYCFFTLAVLTLATHSFARPLPSKIENVPDELCKAMYNSNVLNADNPVQCDRLKLITFTYIDFKGKQHQDGKIMVLDSVAPYYR